MRKRYEMQGVETDPMDEFEDYEPNKQRTSIHSVHPIGGIIFCSVLLALFGFVYVIDNILPTQLTLEDEKDYPDAFIGIRAQHDLKLLTDIGPRIAGSYENEALVVDYFKREISFIQQQAHANQKIELDIQVVSGSYYLAFEPNGAMNAYGNVQNIVVKLYSKNNSKHSLLVNAHFDSVPTSPGGSDDGINCVAMLEILRKLSRSPEQLDHNVIFLWNGAEESPLQAAHGFITQHKWANEVQVVINLEAAGAGGKEILFQAGPGQPWLLKYYQQVPHPNGQAAAEEIFQAGLIPSDTDFRLFRDYGNVIGLDFAFDKDGYRYHTKYDGFSNIPPGTYQHLGDNALSLVRNLANAPELADPHGQPTENFVFYDYVGLFIISYSEIVTIVINVLISMVSTALAIKSFYDFGLGFSRETSVYLSLTVGAILLGWIAAGIFVVIIALFLDAVNFSMSWYNNPWIIFGLYITPIFTLFCTFIALLNHFYNKNNLSISAQAQIQAHLVRLIWTVPLLIGTCMQIRSVYIILVPLIFQTLMAAITQIFRIQHSIRKWQIIYVLGTIIPNIFLMRLAREILGFFVPICSRMGTDKNAELYISVLTFVFTILITSYYAPLITLIRKPGVLLGSFCGIFVLFFIVVFTPLGFAYSGNPNSPAPQRFIVYHTSRVFHNDTNDIYKKDAGFFLLNMDRNSPGSVRKYVKDLSKEKSVKDDCDKSLFCGLPVSSTRLIATLSDSTWIPAEQPIIHEPIRLKLNSKTSITNTVTTFNFTASGPSQLTLYVSPKTDAKLVSSNLIPQVEPEPAIWNGRPIYIILYTWGKVNTPLTFTLDLETPANWKGPTLDIALTGTYKQDRINMKTPHYIQFLSEFPEWADVIAYLGAYESWVY